MIEIFGLNYTYYKNQVLDNLNVKFQKGKVNCIIGKNGSGKSTLLKCISGIYKIEKGSIKIESKNVHEISNKELARKITYLPQIKDVPRITVEKLVSFGRYPYKKYPYTMNDNDNKMINNAIKTIGISNIKDKFLENLSGGEKQKAYLAMAIAQDTDILLLDEVTVF